MTKPQITSQISLGNIIQIILLVVGLTGGWFTMQNRTESALAAAEKNDAALAQTELRIRSLETKRGADLVQIDARVRSLETARAADAEQLSTLRRDISELKQGQRETNELLRELLQRGPAR